MATYNKAYDLWDSMAPSERKAWCYVNEIGAISEDEAGCDAEELSHLSYGLWCTIKDVMGED